MLKGVLPWHLGGLLLALAFFVSVLLIKPVGVSTQFVIASGIVWDLVDPSLVITDPESKSGYSSTNAYLNHGGGKEAKNIANPLNFGLVFVAAMAFGAFLSSFLNGDRPTQTGKTMPDVWKARFGEKATTRYIVTFLSGFIVLFGARLADGCTSGHMMSGMMQTALSGYLFAIGAFATAIPLAIIVYRKK